MGWAVHCREANGVKRFALFSTVTMGYLTRPVVSRRQMVDLVYQMSVEYRERALKLYPDSAPPPPSRDKWADVVAFASEHGNSEYFHYPIEAAKCVPGCRCYRHRPIPNELHRGWW
jgi:hypothetical protein